MKTTVYPKCPYCYTEFNDTSFNSPLMLLYGENASDTVTINCEACGESYYVSKQTVFRGRKKK